MTGGYATVESLRPDEDDGSELWSYGLEEDSWAG